MDIFDVIDTYGFYMEKTYLVDNDDTTQEPVEWEIYSHHDEPINIHLVSKYEYIISTESGLCDIDTLVDYWLSNRPTNK